MLNIILCVIAVLVGFIILKVLARILSFSISVIAPFLFKKQYAQLEMDRQRTIKKLDATGIKVLTDDDLLEQRPSCYTSIR